jgi:chaperonin GroES
MNITPLYDRVIVERVHVNRESTIILPETAQESLVIGRVVNVGTGYYVGDKKIELSITVGNLVLYPNYAGLKYKDSDFDYIILKESDIIGIVNNG